ncbi:MAG TPA: PH domain-containing protein [Patescibacteria group bacterium]|nr:PH domain-containing protein [Patescibacteria group bacterium]
MFKFDLLPGEKVLQFHRQSEAVLFRPVLIIFILIYFPWYFLLKYDLAANFVRLLFLWTLLVLLYAIRVLFLWLLNAYLITDRRLVAINYRGLFSKRVTESPLDRILNVSAVTKGIWQTVCQYGEVQAQVAGLGEPLLLKNVAHPGQIKDYLWQRHRQTGSVAIKTQSL